MNKKFTFAISSKTFITVILLIGLVTSPLTANLSSIDMAYAEEQQQQQHQVTNTYKYQTTLSLSHIMNKLRKTIRKMYFTL